MRGAVLPATAVTLFFAAVQSAQGTKAGHAAAKKWSRAYLNRRSAAPGFDCYRAGTNVTFYCANGAKAYWAERLTATTAASRPAFARLCI